MLIRLIFCSVGVLLSISLSAQMGMLTHFIKVDQFGYLPNEEKIAVISNPEQGFNADESFVPGDVLELRKLENNDLVYSSSTIAWNNGSLHEQSGDYGWWVDFSSIEEAGEYYLYDPTNNVHSHPFLIDTHVYEKVMEAAVRMFFYQRLNFPKLSTYAGENWADEAAFEGPNQDRGARNRFDMDNPATAKDLHGGWMDAGDVNKYTTFATGAVLPLLAAYLHNPNHFTDQYNLPESNNGIPDLLDELKWELDWLARMQDASNTGGLFLKVGVTNYDEYTPLSTDPRPKFYLPECTSATLAGAAMFSLAAVVYRNVPALYSYSEALEDRALSAFTRALETTSNFTTFDLDCDDGYITSGDADRTIDQQVETALIAAIYLFQLTGNTQYHETITTLLSNVQPIADNWWGPYQVPLQEALLFYTTLDGALTSNVNLILDQKAGMDYLYSRLDYAAQTDMYRAFMEDWAHHWGSNQVRSDCGTLNLHYVDYGINTDFESDYTQVALAYLHWLHGLNPLGKVMLSNMYAYDAEHCVDELYHAWFSDGSEWDNVFESANGGPAPGYLTGGPNVNFSVPSITPPGNQPPQKAYKDWNANWPENSWEITEPAIYYQAAYIRLLSHFAMPEEPISSTKNNQVQASSFRLTPNPSGDDLFIHFNGNEKQHINIWNSQGQLIKTYRIKTASPYRVDVTEFPSGYYIMEVNGQKEAFVVIH